MERICRYLQGIKDNGLVFNPYKKRLVDCYADSDFEGLWGHENPQYPICDRSRTVFVISFYQLSSIVGVKITYRYFSFYTAL